MEFVSRDFCFWSLSQILMELDSETYGVGVRDIWNWSLKSNGGGIEVQELLSKCVRVSEFIREMNSNSSPL